MAPLRRCDFNPAGDVGGARYTSCPIVTVGGAAWATDSSRADACYSVAGSGDHSLCRSSFRSQPFHWVARDEDERFVQVGLFYTFRVFDNILMIFALYFTIFHIFASSFHLSLCDIIIMRRSRRPKTFCFCIYQDIRTENGQSLAQNVSARATAIFYLYLKVQLPCTFNNYHALQQKERKSIKKFFNSPKPEEFKD